MAFGSPVTLNDAAGTGPRPISCRSSKLSFREPPAGRPVLQPPQHVIHPIGDAVVKHVFPPELIAVGFSDRALFVRPGVPDAAPKIRDAVRFLLPDPQEFVDGVFHGRRAQRQRRKLPSKIVAVDDAESLFRVRGRTVTRPLRSQSCPTEVYLLSRMSRT